jgi:uncharacterized protein YlxW (UPF0749 family)
MMDTGLASRRTQLVLALALFLLGFGLVMQLRSFEQLSGRLESEAEVDLVEIIDRLDGELKFMRAELMDERLKLVDYQQADDAGKSLLEQTRRDIDKLKMFSGEAPAVGPGVAIKIKDSQRLLTGFDVRQIIEELRASGAWAISVNGIRVGNQSSFWRRAGYVYLDGNKLDAEFTIEAVGAPKLLYQAVTLPRGIKDKLETLRGVSVGIKSRDELDLPPAGGKKAPLRGSNQPTIKQ